MDVKVVQLVNYELVRMDGAQVQMRTTIVAHMGSVAE